MKRILAVLGFCAAMHFSYAQAGADSLLNFISANKSLASLYLVQNDSVIARLNENKRMPLASTVKIMVAIRF